GHGHLAGIERIERAVVVGAVGGTGRQAVEQELDAVLVIVGGIEVGAAAGIEHFIVAVVALGPDPGHIAQHVGELGHGALVEAVAIEQGDRAGGGGTLGGGAGGQVIGGDQHLLQGPRFFGGGGGGEQRAEHDADRNAGT